MEDGSPLLWFFSLSLSQDSVVGGYAALSIIYVTRCRLNKTKNSPFQFHLIYFIKGRGGVFPPLFPYGCFLFNFKVYLMYDTMPLSCSNFCTPWFSLLFSWPIFLIQFPMMGFFCSSAWCSNSSLKTCCECGSLRYLVPGGSLIVSTSCSQVVPFFGLWLSIKGFFSFISPRITGFGCSNQLSLLRSLYVSSLLGFLAINF